MKYLKYRTILGIKFRSTTYLRKQNLEYLEKSLKEVNKVLGFFSFEVINPIISYDLLCLGVHKKILERLITTDRSIQQASNNIRDDVLNQFDSDSRVPKIAYDLISNFLVDFSLEFNKM